MWRRGAVVAVRGDGTDDVRYENGEIRDMIFSGHNRSMTKGGGVYTC